MRRHTGLLIVCIALTAAQSFARAPKAPPSAETANTQATSSLKPDEHNSGENVFIGHFGEIVRLSYFWAADVAMQGPMEVVNFHLATADPLKVVSPRFAPKSKDYIPENFKRLRLMQMMVIPKNAPGGLRSLEKIREAKAKELSEMGGEYKLQQLGDYTWPPNSFWVAISTP